MNLDKAKKGQVVKVTNIDNKNIRTKAIRLGISEGEMITCCQVIPAGPVIVCKRRQQIALGRGLAKKIGVEPVPVPLRQCEKCVLSENNNATACK
ncbi:MAG: ferrous iron transport protein A [Clostridiales bacterium]|nr:ferrous iron transport protein A [Clostridiales bacterium]MCF8021378.1 ferrous iron transport protein A [Clostridiales bacterium]